MGLKEDAGPRKRWQNRFSVILKGECHISLGYFKTFRFAENNHPTTPGQFLVANFEGKDFFILVKEVCIKNRRPWGQAP